MVFPNDPLPVRVEALINGTTWTDITGDTYLSDPITIKRGQANEQSKAEPSSIDLSLNNRSGKYSPRNPAGPYYGLLGRNTQVRVGVTEAAAWLETPGPTTNPGHTGAPVQYIQTPDAAALDITGETDIRFDADFDSWRCFLELVSKNTEAGNQRSYALLVDVNGFLYMYRSTDGISFGVHISTLPVPITHGRIAVRCTFQGNNGAGGRTTRFYTAPTIAGPWTELGDPQTTAGTVTIFAGTSPMAVLDNPGSIAANTAIKGRVYAAQVRNGINGTVVANPDFSGVTPGVTSFADSAGRTWSLTGVKVSNLNVRGHGEVPAWPVRWDRSQKDVWSPIQVAGMMRRLGQGAAPLNSALRRGMTSAADVDVVAYWPVEDPEGSESIGSGLANGYPMNIDGGDNTMFSTFSGFPGSDPIATTGDRSSWNGSVRSYSGGGNIQLWWLMSVPATGTTNNQAIIAVRTTGTIGQVSVRYGTGGTLQVQVRDQDDAIIVTGAAVAFNVNGRNIKCSLDIKQNGINVDIDVKTLEVGAAVGGTTSMTVANRSASRATGVQVSAAGNFPDVAIGHISVQKTIRNLFDSNQELNAWRGERMGLRMRRLASEEGVALRVLGEPGDTVVGGFQESKSLLELLQECADVDGGVLCESRDELSLMYVPASAMQGQRALVTIPYEYMTDLEPTEDDQSLSNDVTVSRAAGSSARVELLAGPLSVNVPPAGAGRYESADTRNLGYDYQLVDYASWLLHLRTVDEARYPQIDFGLEHPDIAGDAVLTDSIRRMDVGDRVVVTGPMPAWVSPDTVDQLTMGTVEVLGAYEHSIVANTVPARPYRGGVYNDQLQLTRYDTGGSTLATGISTTATALSLATTAPGVLWTTVVGSFPFDLMVGPERVRVTAITGTSSPQAATVVRSVNGVVLAHSAGRAVSLADPTYYVL